jgi:small-conductance mechanosensitive channel
MNEDLFSSGHIPSFRIDKNIWFKKRMPVRLAGWLLLLSWPIALILIVATGYTMEELGYDAVGNAIFWLFLPYLIWFFWMVFKHSEKRGRWGLLPY